MRERMEQHRTESGLRVVPQDLRADRHRAREFRRGRRRGAPRTRASRSTRPACSWTGPRSTARRACVTSLMRYSEQFVRVVTEKLLTYALGRGVEYPRHAAGAVDRARRGGRQLPLLVARAGHRQERSVPDEYQGIAERATADRRLARGSKESNHVHYEEAHSPADVPARRGCDAGAAAARLDGAGARRCWRRRRRPRSRASSACFVPHGMSPGYWVPDTEGTRLRDAAASSSRSSRSGIRLSILSGLHCPVGRSAARAEPAPTTGWRRPSCARTSRSGPPAPTSTTARRSIRSSRRRSARTPCCRRCSSPSRIPGANSSNCGEGYSCAYTNSISWSTPTTPLPMELNPQVVFERMFGDGSTAEERAARRQDDRSILDSLHGQPVAPSQPASDPADRARLDEYAEDVREIERRLQIASEGLGGGADRHAPFRSACRNRSTSTSSCSSICWRWRFRGDITRVAHDAVSPATSPSASYPESGVTVGVPRRVAPRRRSRSGWRSTPS